MESITRLVKLLVGLRKDPGRLPYLALLPLRLFLGITFIYAGLNKFTDPQFFSPTAPGFIGRQMSGYVQSDSPLSPLLTHLAIPHAALFGAVIALGELWIGISTLTGLLTRLGALGGLVTNLVFFLTATWTVHPYFLGGDLPYAAGWLTLLLAGPGLYSLDEYFFGKVVRDLPAIAEQPTHKRHKGQPSPAAMRWEHEHMTRAAFIRGLGTAVALALLGAVVGGIAKLMTPEKVFTHTATRLGPPAGNSTSSNSNGNQAASVAPSPTPASASSVQSTPTSAPTASGGRSAGRTAVSPPSPTATPAQASVPPGATLLGSVKSLPPNSAGEYTDPASGDPALLIRLASGRFVSYDAVCTHAGCLVQYDPTQKLIVCPCHGAAYDPAQGAQVVAGPAPYPLAKLKVKITPDGKAYALD